MSKGVDLIGQEVFLILKDFKNKQEFLRQLFHSCNEKIKSVGILYENLSETIELLSDKEFSGIKQSLIGFSTIIRRIEYYRKILYQREDLLINNLFLNNIESYNSIYNLFTKRDESILKVRNIKSNDLSKSNQNNNLRITASTINTQCIQESFTWFGQFNNELKKLIKDFAEIEIEFSCHCIEQWSNFIEDLTLIDFNKDTDEIISILEQGNIVTTENS